jgi:Protein of unknown function (DUF3293)
MSLPPEYLSTVFLLEDPPDPLPPAFAIVTAWNPDGVTVDESSNDAADRSLLRDLVERGLSGFRVTGCSPDLSHREPGWGAVLSKAEAIALGRHHRQLAVWLVLDDELILLDCKTGEESRIATFSERIEGR